MFQVLIPKLEIKLIDAQVFGAIKSSASILQIYLEVERAIPLFSDAANPILFFISNVSLSVT